MANGRQGSSASARCNSPRSNSSPLPRATGRSPNSDAVSRPAPFSKASTTVTGASGAMRTLARQRKSGPAPAIRCSAPNGRHAAPGWSRISPSWAKTISRGSTSPSGMANRRTRATRAVVSSSMATVRRPWPDVAGAGVWLAAARVGKRVGGAASRHPRSARRAPIVGAQRSVGNPVHSSPSAASSRRSPSGIAATPAPRPSRSGGASFGS